MEYVLFRKVNELLDSSSECYDSSSSSEDEYIFVVKEARENHMKMKSRYYDSLKTNHCSDSDFQSHFKITRTSLQALLENIKANEIHCTGRPRFPLKDALLLTIWTISNQESFRAIADRFRLNRANAYKIFTQTCRLIAAQVKKYVIWPMGDDVERTVNEFNSFRGKSSFPGVLGCLDCTHIPIPKPVHDNSYYNKKEFHSIILQGICNARQEFINIFCGWPGSADDATVWENCSVNKALLYSANQLLLPNTYLLGDSAYPLQKFLLVPFKDNGHLSNNQKRFNCKMNSTRIVIEKAFERMKNQFRRLNYVNVSVIENATSIVTSACILHNILIRDGSEYILDEEDSIASAVNEFNEEAEIDEEAIIFRNQIMNSIV